MSNSSLAVITYNIHKGFDTGNRRFVLHQIREALAKTNADVLCLQEMQGEHLMYRESIPDWPESSQFEFLAERGWPHHYYAKNVEYRAGHHGNAILSRYPLLNCENINVSPFTWASRSVLHGIVEVNSYGRPIHVICVHFGLTSVERRKQALTLSARIDSHIPHDEPLIIAGDFNDWLGMIDRHFHDDLGLKEVFKDGHGAYARTFPVWFPVLPMDRVYYRGITPIACERLNRAPWTSLSDHAPLRAEFALP